MSCWSWILAVGCEGLRVDNRRAVGISVGEAEWRGWCEGARPRREEEKMKTQDRKLHDCYLD